MEAAQSIPTRDNVAHSRVNHHQVLLGNWNILTLKGKEVELVEKAKRYHFDIIGVSSTKRSSSRTVHRNGGWKLFYFGVESKCLLKQEWGFSQATNCQTVCQIVFIWDDKSAC